MAGVKNSGYFILHMYRLFQKKRSYAILGAIISLNIFAFCQIAKATDITMVDTSLEAYHGGSPSDWSFMGFTASHISINKIDLYGRYNGTTTIPSLTLKICEGNVIAGTNSGNFNCSLAGQSEVTEVIYPNPSLIGVSTTTLGWITLEFTDVDLEFGKTYYFSFRETNPATWDSTYSYLWGENNSDVYSGGLVRYYDGTTSGHDLLMTLWYDDGFAQAGEVEVYDSQADAYICSFEPCFYFTEYQYCYLDKLPCRFEITYNSLAKGATANLLNYGDFWPYQAIASTTLSATSTIDSSLIIPVDETSSSSEYSIYLESPYGDVLKSKKFVEWVYSWEIDGVLSDFAYQDCTCDTIATSSGSFWDDFRYGIECGYRKTYCWFLYPTEYGRNLLKKTNDIAVKQFPVSVGHEIYEAFATTTTATIDLEISPPDSLGFASGTTLVSSTTVRTGLGETLYYYYVECWKYIFYLGAISYMAWFLFFRNRYAD